MRLFMLLSEVGNPDRAGLRARNFWKVSLHSSLQILTAM